jgi:hypothetical protein
LVSYLLGVIGSQPYALATPVFAFRALAALAGRAPLGGPRETAIATLIAARLVAGVLEPFPLLQPLRKARADAAKLWLSSVALPTPIRTSVLRLIDATTGEDRRIVAQALGKVTDVTAPHLDRGARSELERLAARLAV